MAMTDCWADKQKIFFLNHRGAAIAPPPPPHGAAPVDLVEVICEVPKDST